MPFQILRALLRLMPSEPRVVGFMVDYEPAMWRALRELFHNATIKCCIFHLTQTVWRQVQQLGLQTAYNEKKDTHSFIIYICEHFLVGNAVKHNLLKTFFVMSKSMPSMFFVLEDLWHFHFYQQSTLCACSTNWVKNFMEFWINGCTVCITTSEPRGLTVTFCHHIHGRYIVKPSAQIMIWKVTGLLFRTVFVSVTHFIVIKYVVAIK